MVDARGLPAAVRGIRFYINKASNPFITPAFFKNTRWLRAICLILVFYFVNYALSPIFNAIGTNIYGMTTTQVSLHIVWAFVVAAVVGTCSGMIIRKIGIKAGIVTAGTSCSSAGPVRHSA